MGLRALASSALVVVAACAAPTPPASPPSVPPASSAASTPVSADAIAPIPYTEDELRVSCRDGHQLVFRVEAEGKPTLRRTMRFVGADETGVEVESIDTTEDGKLAGEPGSSRATWSDLRRHAAFPRSTTTLAPATIETPVGSFPSTLYVTKDGDTVRKFWFARDLPGPPVRFSTEKNGRIVFSSTLVGLTR